MSSVKVIIAGGREYNDYNQLTQTMNRLLCLLKEHTKVVIISGGARGADELGARYAQDCNYELIVMNADWETYGRRAGYLRNLEMAHAATHCVCFWDGQSRGTAHMIDTAKNNNLKLHVTRY